MSQDVRERVIERAAVVHCGERPGDLRVKVERRPRGRLETASLRIRSMVSRVKAH
jgi:hypothetical protein